MKKHLIFMAIGLILLTGCTYPPDLRVLVQNKSNSYERDHCDCLERARIAWPCTDSQLRSPMRVARDTAFFNLKHQKIMIIHCLEGKGYIVKTKRLEQPKVYPIVPIGDNPLKPFEPLYW